MKKKYKLIKWYPSLPIWMKRPEEFIVTKLTPFDYYLEQHTLKTTEVENNPEFWEEVKEETYKIIAYSQEGYIYDENHVNWDHIKKMNYPIHSIKRLSDGEVFSVGDRVETSTSPSYCSIYSFKIKDDNLRIDYTHSFLADIKGIDLLSDMKHYKEPIKVGDRVYRVWPSGKKTMGIACGYKWDMHNYTDTNLPFTHFWSLEDYREEGGVKKNEGYGKGDHKYEKIEPLFISDDNIKLYEGDSYYTVFKEDSCTQQRLKVYGSHKVEKVYNRETLSDKCLYFSTEEAAEKWIEMNKPSISKKELKEAIKEWTETTNNDELRYWTEKKFNL